MESPCREALIRKFDCLQLPVPDLESGLAFYRDRLGHTVIWRTTTAVGLRLPESDAELVLQTERPEMECNLLVASIDEAARAIADAGGQIVVPPFETQIGQGIVAQDPWGNQLILLDISKGLLETDSDGRVIGNRTNSVE